MVDETLGKNHLAARLDFGPKWPGLNLPMHDYRPTIDIYG